MSGWGARVKKTCVCPAPGTTGFPGLWELGALGRRVPLCGGTLASLVRGAPGVRGGVSSRLTIHRPCVDSGGGHEVDKCCAFENSKHCHACGVCACMRHVVCLRRTHLCTRAPCPVCVGAARVHVWSVCTCFWVSTCLCVLHVAACPCAHMYVLRARVWCVYGTRMCTGGLEACCVHVCVRRVHV